MTRRTIWTITLIVGIVLAICVAGAVFYAGLEGELSAK